MSEFIQALLILSVVAIVAMTLGKSFTGKINNDSSAEICVNENEDKKNK